MPDWFTLYIVLWILRSLEYVWWVPGGAVLFRGSYIAASRPIGPAHGDNRESGRFLLGNPLDVVGDAYLTHGPIGERPRRDEILARVSAYRRASTALLRAESALLIQLFLVVPLVWSTLGITRTWPYLLTGALILQLLTLVFFARAYASLAAPGEESWWWKVLPFALSPPAATAAHLALTKPLLRRYHPIEVADSLCNDEWFRTFALSEWRRIGFTRASTREGAASDIELEGPGSRERQALQELVETRLGSDALLHLPPPRRSPGARSYCPRCHTQYITMSGDCTDCVGVPLRPYDAASALGNRDGTTRSGP